MRLPVSFSLFIFIFFLSLFYFRISLFSLYFVIYIFFLSFFIYLFLLLFLQPTFSFSKQINEANNALTTRARYWSVDSTVEILSMYICIALLRCDWLIKNLELADWYYSIRTITVHTFIPIKEDFHLNKKHSL